MGFRLFVLLERRSGPFASIPWGLRGTVVFLANKPVGIPPIMLYVVASLLYANCTAGPMAIFDPIFAPKIEDGGFCFLRSRKNEEPPPSSKKTLPPSSKNFPPSSILVSDERRMKNPLAYLQSSIFGPEKRRTPPASIFGSRRSDRRWVEGGGFFEDGGRVFFEDGRQVLRSSSSE